MTTREQELEKALRELTTAAPDPAFVRQAALADDSDPADMIEEGARCYREALEKARKLLEWTPEDLALVADAPRGCLAASPPAPRETRDAPDPANCTRACQYHGAHVLNCPWATATAPRETPRDEKCCRCGAPVIAYSEKYPWAHKCTQCGTVQTEQEARGEVAPGGDLAPALASPCPDLDELPEEVTEEIREYARAVENTMGWSAGPGAWTAREEARAALESAILSALRRARGDR